MINAKNIQNIRSKSGFIYAVVDLVTVFRPGQRVIIDEYVSVFRKEEGDKTWLKLEDGSVLGCGIDIECMYQAHLAREALKDEP